MARKKRARFTQKKKNVTVKAIITSATKMHPLPDPRFCNSPLPPLRLTEDARLALLPWLAQGFCPVQTPGMGHLCGLFALWRAFREARDALNLTGEKIQHIPQRRFREFLNGDEYNKMADKVLRAQSKLGFVADEEEFKELLAQKSNLDITQIGILLELANQEAGTNFALGYVTEGWRCRLNKETNVYDNTFVSPSTANLAGDLLGDTAQRPARPVIWLWNDNHIEKQEAWGQDSESLNHWEAFGRFELGDFDHYARVRNWHIGNTLKGDLRQVWMVTQDRNKTNKNELAVIKGTFVRNTVPDCIVPQGWRFVAAYNDMQGLVPRNILSSDIISPAASSLFNKNYGSNTPTSVGNSSTPELVQNSSGQQQEAKPRSEASQGNGRVEHDQLELRFFRAISPTDKMGQVTNESFAIDKFDFKTGHILFDSTERRDGIPTVSTANGNFGEAHSRRLQHIEFAWGMPSPVRGILADNRNMKGIKGNGSSPIPTASQYQHSLPLYRLTKSYSATEAQSNTAFFKDEIVRGLRREENEGSKFYVLDFESKLGIVDFGALETFGHSGYTGQHDYPFGIQLLEDIPSNHFEQTIKEASSNMLGAAAENLSAAEVSLSVPGVIPSIQGSPVESSDPKIQEQPSVSEVSFQWEEDPSEEAKSDSPSPDPSDSSDIESSKKPEKSNANLKSTKRSRDDDLEEESPKEKKQKP